MFRAYSHETADLIRLHQQDLLQEAAQDRLLAQARLPLHKRVRAALGRLRGTRQQQAAPATNVACELPC